MARRSTPFAPFIRGALPPFRAVQGFMALGWHKGTIGKCKTNHGNQARPSWGWGHIRAIGLDLVWR
jgi:hypothetical protein